MDSFYKFLEEVVNGKEGVLKEYLKVYGSNDDRLTENLDILKKIAKNSFYELQGTEAGYGRIFYKKGQLESIKLDNIEVDIELIINMLSAAYNMVSGEKWAIFMALLSVIATLKKAVKRLPPTMSVIVLFLYENGYKKEAERTIGEDVLREKIRKRFETELSNVNFEEEYTTAINGLLEWKIIGMENGNISLKEKMKI